MALLCFYLLDSTYILNMVYILYVEGIQSGDMSSIVSFIGHQLPDYFSEPDYLGIYSYNTTYIVHCILHIQIHSQYPPVTHILCYSHPLYEVYFK